MGYEFNKIALGGTFDYLHKGHKSLIDFAFSISKFVTIGIIGDDFVKDKSVTNTYEYRKSKVADFLNEKGYTKRTEIVKLADIFGPTAGDRTFGAIVVTKDSERGAKLINEERMRKGLKALKVLKFDLLKAENGSVISSTLIRNGKIDDNGKYFASGVINNTYYLPEGLRKDLSKPLGKIYKKIDRFAKDYKDKRIISVGDETTRSLLGLGLNLHLVIIDFKINRKILFKDLSEFGLSDNKSIVVKNDAGTINKGLSRAIFDFFESQLDHFVIRVDGEEDLAVIPVILLSPLGNLVVYGQPGEGLVVVEVTLELKKEILALLDKFQIKN